MPRSFRLFSTFCFSLLLSTASLAAELTDQTIKQWVGAYQAVQIFCQERDRKDLDFMKEQPAARDMSNLFTQAIQQMKGHPIYSDFAGVLGANGYSDPMEWASQGDRIMAASLATQLDKTGKASADQRAQMQQAMQTVQNNPNLTAQQKAQLQQMMGLGSQMVDAAEKVPPADKAAVQRNEPLLRTIMTDIRPKN